MKRLALLISILALPSLAFAQANEADEKLAREVMYCGLFTMKLVRTQKRPGHEARYRAVADFVQVALFGLGVTEQKKLQKEEEARIASEVNEARSKGAFAEDAVRTYMIKKGEECEKVLDSPEVKAAHARGVAAIREQSQRNKAPEGKSEESAPDAKPNPETK